MHPGTRYITDTKELSHLRKMTALLFYLICKGIAMDKIILRPGLDPEWKRKLTECLKEIGLLSAPYLQVTVNVADYRVSDVTKQERLK